MAATTVAFADLADYLAGLDDNTADTPYELNITGLTDDVMYCSDSVTLTEGTLRYVLRNNSTKYVSLCFSSNGLTATNAVYALAGCTSVVSVSGNNSNLAVANNMFQDCTNLKKAENLTLIYTTYAESMFSGCTALESIAGSTFINVKRAGSMFADCNALKSIDFAAFPAATGIISMCINCISLTDVDISGMNNVTNAAAMFSGCTALKTANISGMNNVTDADTMFSGCTALKTVSITGLGAATNTSSMFAFCESLETADIQGLESVTNASLMFRNCTNLAEITNWSMDADKLTSFSNIFRSTSSSLKVYLPDARKTHGEFRLVRVRADSDGNVTVRTRGTSDSSAADTTLTASIGSALRFKGQIDEIATAPEITDAQFTKMIEKRYKWCADGSGALDPDASSLVLWAKDPSAVRSNFLSDVVVEDALTLTGDDFDEIFS